MLPIFIMTFVVVSICILLASISYWITGKLKLSKGCGRRPIWDNEKCQPKGECTICGKKGDL